MAQQARRASALLLRRCSFLAADCTVAPPGVNRARGLVSLSLVSFTNKERTTGSRDRPGWRVRAGAVVGGAAAVTGFMSLLPPAVTSCEALQQIEGSESVQQSAEAVVATETLDGNKDAPRILSADTVTHLLAELRAICDEDRVVVDVDEREFHAKSWNTYHSMDAIPDIVVHPESQEEVVAIVRACAKFKVPVTPFAGGTSLEGHTMTLQRGVSIDMNSMKKVKELHLEDMDVIVEPGIGWIELNEYLKPHGLFFPLDPGPGATIGGMCATRCSGSMAVRYGTMRDNVISLKAVMANGDLVKTGARARKSAAGYDLARLLIGSEGTLGVITEVTLRLQKIPEATVVAMCNFKSVGDAAAVAIATMHSGIQVSRVELLDEVMMKAINVANDKDYPEEATLMFELIGTEAYALEQTARVQKIVEEHNGSDFVFANTPIEKEELWKIRKEAFWSTFVLRPGAEAMVTDVCVPLSRLAECISSTKTRLLASSLPNTILAHAGDGNFHAIILFDPKNKEEVYEALALSNEMVHASLSMEGTCTGEHGIGVGKMKYLEKELGPEAMTMMGTIKQALDPSNLMNPGKVIPEKFCY